MRRIYAKLKNISVDYAILEPATRLESTAQAGADTRPQRGPASATADSQIGQSAPRVFVIPAEVGWSDIGSWAAVYELLAKRPGENVFAGPGQAIDAEGNFLWSPSKFVAAIGACDLVVVDTPEALLIVPRDRAQDVANLVKLLEEQKLKKLL